MIYAPMGINMDGLKIENSDKPLSPNAPVITILVVEDDQVQSFALCQVLRKKGYQVFTAFDGANAVEMLEYQKVNLIVSDIDMPVLDGYELCRLVKNDSRFYHIPLILLTSLTGPQDLIQGLMAKADFFLTKPVVEEYLFRQISILLLKPSNPEMFEESPIDFVIDGKTYQVTASRSQILKILLVTYENALIQNRALLETQYELQTKSQQLQISETNYYELMENSQDGIMVVDNNGFVRFANSAVGSILRKELSSITAHPCDFKINPNSVREISLHASEGNSVTIELHTRETVWEGSGAYLLILRDITQRKLDEQKILEQQQQLIMMNKQLELLAITDGLTGLKNHRAFVEKLEEEWLRSARFETPFSLVLLDVDHFKKYNDSFGHPAGDVVLKKMGVIIKEATRITDFPARYGGEEFVIILPNTNQMEALKFGERLRYAIEHAHWQNRPVTASIGITTSHKDTKDHAQLVSEADQALYYSKNSGRNRVTHISQIQQIQQKP